MFEDVLETHDAKKRYVRGNYVEMYVEILVENVENFLS